MEQELRTLRKEAKMSQVEAATFLAIPLRTYQNYENDIKKTGSIKYQYMINRLQQHLLINEDHGLLTIDIIKDVCHEIFNEYGDVEFCYLFGSYAKGYANESSDVDLFISTTILDLRYFGILEDLSNRLHKRIDLLNQRQVKNDGDFLIHEIMGSGIKIYG